MALTNAGRDFIAAQVSGTPTATTASTTLAWIGLTADTGQTIDATQTTLTAEIAVNGLTRQQATYAHTNGTTTWTLTKTFTYTAATSTTVTRMGLFTAVSAGTMGFITALASSATVSANGDTLTVTHTITI